MITGDFTGSHAWSNLVQIGAETADKRWREKKKRKKIKPTENYNITPDLEKCNFDKKR